jgi:hypothetical protein
LVLPHNKEAKKNTKKKRGGGRKFYRLKIEIHFLKETRQEEKICLGKYHLKNSEYYYKSSLNPGPSTLHTEYFHFKRQKRKKEAN